MILERQFIASAAVLAAALLFPGCQTARTDAPIAHPPAQARLVLGTSPAVSPATAPIAGWIEWVSEDGQSAVIELERAENPQAGLVWWTRDSHLAPTAALAIQAPTRGRRLGAKVVQGKTRVGEDVLASNPRLAPKFPPLQTASPK